MRTSSNNFASSLRVDTDDYEAEGGAITPHSCTSSSKGWHSPHKITAMQKKQVAQLREKGIDEEGCAAILNLDIETIKQLNRPSLGSTSIDEPSPDIGLDEKEKNQLRELFARQVDPDTCADILHIEPALIKEFQAEESARIYEAEWSRLEEDSTARLMRALQQAGGFAMGAADSAKTSALAGVAAAAVLAKERKFQVAAVSTVAGSGAGAVIGGGSGVVVGGVVGGVAGIGPALFTFGTSIPITATMGSAIGLCIGTVSGAVAGGACGYAGFSYRNVLKEQGKKLVGTVDRSAKLLWNKTKAHKPCKEVCTELDDKVAAQPATSRAIHENQFLGGNCFRVQELLKPLEAAEKMTPGMAG